MVVMVMLQLGRVQWVSLLAVAAVVVVGLVG